MGELGWQFLKAVHKRAILQGIEDGAVYGGPYHLELHPTDRCNLRCCFCSTRSLRAGRELAFDTIRRLVEEMRRAGTLSVCLSGGGEPLVHSRILDVLDLLARAGIRLSNLTTNGLSLHREVATRLLDGRCDQLRISLNCSNETDYARMMQTGRGAFHRVLANVRRLLSERARRGISRPEVIVQFLPYRASFRSIPEMVALAARLGVDGIVFNGLAYLEEDEKMTAAEEVRPMCSCAHPGAGRCHIRSFYYCRDLPFFRALRETAAALH